MENLYWTKTSSGACVYCYTMSTPTLLSSFAKGLRAYCTPHYHNTFGKECSITRNRDNQAQLFGRNAKYFKENIFKMEKSLNLPPHVHEWTRDHVILWVTEQLKLDSTVGNILYNQEVTGESLKILSKNDFVEMGIKHGPAALLAHHIKKMSPPNTQNFQQDTTSISEISAKRKKNQSQKVQSSCVTLQDKIKTTTEENLPKELEKVKATCPESDYSHVRVTPYPFDSTHESKCYTQHHCLPPESGASNLIDPVHEYKEFTNIANATEEDKKMKFCNEVFKFAAACMNVRTNGTIHFGVRDKPHGEIIGIVIDDIETYVRYIDQMVNKYFDEKQVDIAKQCIRPPRFVSVLYQENIKSDLVVIEVDVVPEYAECKSEIFHTYPFILTDNTWKKSLDQYCFIRDGGSSKNVLANVRHNCADYKLFCTKLKDRDDARIRAEHNQKTKQRKTQEHGSKLVSLITGNRDTLDNSYYKWYILVANKCQTSHTKHLQFMHEINWFAILDFDPESATHGLCKAYQEKRKPNLHFPNQYQNMDNDTNEKIQELKLHQQPSWIFCNGRLDLNSEEYKPLNNKLWQKEKAAEVRQLVTFLSRKDILERGKFLVVFLLLSTVEDSLDPMNEMFIAFYQELRGMTDILCICECEQTFQRWRDLQTRIINKEEMEERCIYYLSIDNINGTILKLKSNTQTSSRFLPSHDGSSTILHRKDEDLLTSLDILCANECHNTEIESNKSMFNTFMKTQEEHFYRGGKATWWNFYFSFRGHTGSFIKRDVQKKLEEQIKSWSEYNKQISVKVITLFHHPGCGGSTTAMHVLWELRDTFRCATLKRKTDDFKDISTEVINLAVHGSSNCADYYPVLLLMDDYEEDETASILQNSIQLAIAERYIRFEKPVVIILNCMRSQKPDRSSKLNCMDSVAVTYKLSVQEQRAFETKLKEIEEKYEKPEDFYSFMIMKSNFDKKYMEKVVQNILKGLNNASKEAQLISFLALLNKYVKDCTISASMCEQFLGINVKKTYWGDESLEDKMGAYFTLMLPTEVEEYGRYEGLRIIHPLMAEQCIMELKSTYDIPQSSIMLDLLQNNVFHNSGIGRNTLNQNMQSMLVTRHKKIYGDETDTLFSPLIEEILKDEGSTSVEKVLKEGSVRFNRNPYICQALARHYYIREKNFPDAFHWAKEAKRIAPTNSFVLDTLGQIYKTQLKTMLDKFSKNNPVSSEELNTLLETAHSASNAFRECQERTKKSESDREEYEIAKARRYRVYNTAGYMGQIEVCLYTVDILLQLPWIRSKDKLSRRHLMQYLSGKWDISVDNVSKNYEEIYKVLNDYRSFLTNVIKYLKKAFDFFQDYFVYLKQRNMLKESTDYKDREKVSEYRKKYMRVFCEYNLIQMTDQKDAQKMSPSVRIEEFRVCLESYKADRVSGILEYLTDYGKDVKKLEAIIKAYTYLLQNRTDKFILRDKQNFILANIVLHCISPSSPHIAPVDSLKQYLREILQICGSDHKYPEPYFLASLLFWPQNIYQLDSDSQNIEIYVNSLRKSFKSKYRHMSHAKQPIAHFYLGKNAGLKRLIHKGKLDQSFSVVQASVLNSLWQSGEIWKEAETKESLLLLYGRAEKDQIYIECENGIKIPVRPAYLGQLRSGKSIERVSFFLGFSMEGLIAYNIESL
ncbi:LOW QUALITY PROTEIN: sterile alpha motif domain-containing protein 9-like [Pseudophryne corroboree]|uniref:LOW QUALITY PROTEIN: sterile alpha motif domain-containing protein 9-like n=1 Tax=Pseudophryne corroboree TaxID=495146 RepID=UPI0030814B7B